MIPFTIVEQDTERVIERLLSRGFIEAQAKVEVILEFDAKRRELLKTIEAKRAEMNKIAKQVGIEVSKGNTEAAEKAKLETQDLKQEIANLESQLDPVQAERDRLLIELPNLPHPSVPIGKSSEENFIVQQNGKQLDLPSNKLPHWELAKKHDLIDWELGVKITGAGFPIYKGKGAKLQRALINYFLEKATSAGYLEIQPPILVNRDSGYGTGQLPDKDGQMYYVGLDELYLIPTAEVPITNLYRDVIVDEDELPIKLCGYTPCFRREAGSYGKDVRGLNRLHQFDKVEIVQIVHPENSYEVLEEMLSHAQGLLDELDLPYRTALLCTGDMGFTSAKTYDLEVWSGAQELWLEVSSVSNFEHFQANRLRLRYKNKEKKNI